MRLIGARSSKPARWSQEICPNAAKDVQPVGSKNRQFRRSTAGSPTATSALRLGGRDVVVRLPGKDTELLGHRPRRRARGDRRGGARPASGPQVVAFLTEPPCLVTAFIPGSAARGRGDARAAAARRRSPRRCARVHAGPPLPSRFDAFAIVDAYRATAARRGGVAIPRRFDRLAAGARAIRRRSTGPEHAPVPCHNDLLTANFLHDGARVRIVDWEYAGMGDRYFDLGNLSVNNGFAEADDERAARRVLGRAVHAAALRRAAADADHVRLPRGRCGASCRPAISALDFDFAGYADEHLTRVAAGLADPRFPTWLEDARGDQP